MTDGTTRPSPETRATEHDDATTPAGADRAPTADEERIADEHQPDPEVAEHEREMAERGARQEGEGRIP
jgi:hypothetical protein